MLHVNIFHLENSFYELLFVLSLVVFLLYPVTRRTRHERVRDRERRRGLLLVGIVFRGREREVTLGWVRLGEQARGTSVAARQAKGPSAAAMQEISLLLKTMSTSNSRKREKREREREKERERERER